MEILIWQASLPRELLQLRYKPRYKNESTTNRLRQNCQLRWITISLPRKKTTTKQYACIVKCEQVKTIEYRFVAARQPKATSKPSHSLAEAMACDYATAAVYNKPLLRVSISEKIDEGYRDRLKHRTNFVSKTYETPFCTPFVHPSENHNWIARLHS